MAEPRLDDGRRGGRGRRGADRGVGRAVWVRDRLGDRGRGVRDRDLALHRTRRLSELAERRAQKLVAISFLLLAPYIAQDAIRTLVSGEHPSTSWVGVGLSVSSIVIMPVLGRAKQHIGQQLGSAATASEGAQNLLCAYMAAGVLVGLLANTVIGWWWLDPVIAVGIAALAVREGREAWAGEDCACTTIPGLADRDEDCCG